MSSTLIELYAEYGRVTTRGLIESKRKPHPDKGLRQCPLIYGGDSPGCLRVSAKGPELKIKIPTSAISRIK